MSAAAEERYELEAFLRSSASIGWIGRAACIDADPALFDDHEPPLPKAERVAVDTAAASYCQVCTVIAACAAMRMHATGIWGGVRHGPRTTRNLVAELRDTGEIAYHPTYRRHIDKEGPQ